MSDDHQGDDGGGPQLPPPPLPDESIDIMDVDTHGPMSTDPTVLGHQAQIIPFGEGRCKCNSQQCRDLNLSRELDAILGPTVIYSSQSQLDKIWSLLAHGQISVASYLATLNEYRVESHCGFAWPSGYVAYRCRTCSKALTMSLCVECFRAGNHEGHDYNMFKSRIGGACDCGSNILKESGHCNKHGRNARALRSNESLPSHLVCVPRRSLPRMIHRLTCQLRRQADGISSEDVYLDCLIQVANSSAVLRDLMIEVLISEEAYCEQIHVHHEHPNDFVSIYAQGSLKILERERKKLVAFKLPPEWPVPAKRINAFCDSGAPIRSFLEELVFWVIVNEFNQKLVCFLLGFLTNDTYRELFSRIFVRYYPHIAMYLTGATGEPRRNLRDSYEQMSRRIVQISLQIYNCQHLTRKLCEEELTLHTIIYCLRIAIEGSQADGIFSALKPNPLCALSVHSPKVVCCDNLIIRERNLGSFTEDLNAILDFPEETKFLLRDKDLLSVWLGMLSYFQTMSPYKRELHEHTPYETGPHVSVFTIENEFCLGPLWSMLAHLEANSELVYTRNLLEAIHGNLCAWFHRMCLSPNSRLDDYHMSFHIPLHRMFAATLRHIIYTQGLADEHAYKLLARNQAAIGHKYIYRSVQGGRISIQRVEDFLKMLMLHPMQALTLYHQIRSSMWTRNGLMTINQAVTYVHCAYCYSTIDLDMFLLRYCASKLRPDYFLISLLRKFYAWQCLSFMSGPVFNDPISAPASGSGGSAGGGGGGSTSSNSFQSGRLFNQNIRPEQLTQLVESCLVTLIQLLTLSIQCNISDREQTKQELISIISVADRSYSYLVDMLPDKSIAESARNSDNFEPLLEELTNYKPAQHGSGSNLQQGCYTLKPGILEREYNPMHVLYRYYQRRDYQMSLERFFQHAKLTGKLDRRHHSSSLWPPLKIPPSIGYFGALNLGPLIGCQTLLGVIFSILYKSLYVEDIPESMMAYTIHLLELSLRNCLEKRRAFELRNKQSKDIKMDQQDNDQQDEGKEKKRKFEEPARNGSYTGEFFYRELIPFAQSYKNLSKEEASLKGRTIWSLFNAKASEPSERENPKYFPVVKHALDLAFESTWFPFEEALDNCLVHVESVHFLTKDEFRIMLQNKTETNEEPTTDTATASTTAAAAAAAAASVAAQNQQQQEQLNQTRQEAYLNRVAAASGSTRSIESQTGGWFGIDGASFSLSNEGNEADEEVNFEDVDEISADDLIMEANEDLDELEEFLEEFVAETLPSAAALSAVDQVRDYTTSMLATDSNYNWALPRRNPFLASIININNNNNNNGNATQSNNLSSEQIEEQDGVARGMQLTGTRPDSTPAPAANGGSLMMEAQSAQPTHDRATNTALDRSATATTAAAATIMMEAAETMMVERERGLGPNGNSEFAATQILARSRLAGLTVDALDRQEQAEQDEQVRRNHQHHEQQQQQQQQQQIFAENLVTERRAILASEPRAMITNPTQPLALEAAASSSSPSTATATGHGLSPRNQTLSLTHEDSVTPMGNAESTHGTSSTTDSGGPVGREELRQANQQEQQQQQQCAAQMERSLSEIDIQARFMPFFQWRLDSNSRQVTSRSFRPRQMARRGTYRAGAHMTEPFFVHNPNNQPTGALSGRAAAYPPSTQTPVHPPLPPPPPLATALASPANSSTTTITTSNNNNNSNNNELAAHTAASVGASSATLDAGTRFNMIISPEYHLRWQQRIQQIQNLATAANLNADRSGGDVETTSTTSASDGLGASGSQPPAETRVRQTARRSGHACALHRFLSSRSSQQNQQQQHENEQQRQQREQEPLASSNLPKDYRQHHGESILTLLLRLHAKYSLQARSYQFDEQRAAANLDLEQRCRIGDGAHFVTIVLDLICASDVDRMRPRIEHLRELIWPAAQAGKRDNGDELERKPVGGVFERKAPTNSMVHHQANSPFSQQKANTSQAFASSSQPAESFSLSVQGTSTTIGPSRPTQSPNSPPQLQQLLLPPPPTTASSGPVSVASLAPEERRRRAKERQSRLMAEFANKQRAFLEKYASGGRQTKASMALDKLCGSNSGGSGGSGGGTIGAGERVTAAHGEPPPDEEPINLSSKLSYHQETKRQMSAGDKTTSPNQPQHDHEQQQLPLQANQQGQGQPASSSTATHHDKGQYCGQKGQAATASKQETQAEVEQEAAAAATAAAQYECCICGVEGPSDLSNPLGQVVLLQSTSIYGHSHLRPKSERKLPCDELEHTKLKEETYAKHLESRIDLLCEHFSEASWLDSINIGAEGGVHVQSCGHYLHIECHQSYIRSLDQEDRLRARNDSDEFLCPVCRQLANSVLPILNSSSPMLAGLNKRSKNLALVLSDRLDDQVALIGSQLRQRAPPDQKELQSSAAFCSHLTKATGPQYRLVRSNASMHSLFLFLTSIARTNMETEMIIRSLNSSSHAHEHKTDATINEPTTSSSEACHHRHSSSAASATTCHQGQQPAGDKQGVSSGSNRSSKRTCFQLLFHVLALNAQTLINDQWFTCDQIWSHLTHRIDETHRLCVKPANSEMPLLLRDPVAMLLQFLFAIANSTLCYRANFTCLVRILYNLTVIQSIALVLSYAKRVPPFVFAGGQQPKHPAAAAATSGIPSEHADGSGAVHQEDYTRQRQAGRSAKSSGAGGAKSGEIAEESMESDQHNYDYHRRHHHQDNAESTSLGGSAPLASSSFERLVGLVSGCLAPLLAPTVEEPLMNSIVRSGWLRFAGGVPGQSASSASSSSSSSFQSAFGTNKPSEPMEAAEEQATDEDGRQQMEFIANKVKLACMPFLRAAAFLQDHLYDQPMPNLLLASDDDSRLSDSVAIDADFDALLACLNLVQQQPPSTSSSSSCNKTITRTATTSTTLTKKGKTACWPLEASLQWPNSAGPNGELLVASWAAELIRFGRDFSIAARSLLVCRPLAWYRPALMQLPRAFDDIFMFYYRKKCNLCQQVPKDVAVCLVCGAPICFRVSCCKDRSRSRQVHSHHCGANTAVFLAVHTSSIVVIRGSRACVWGSVYLDAHDEEDNGLQRGKPLYLVPARFALLEQQWLTHSFDHTCGKRWIYLQEGQ